MRNAEGQQDRYKRQPWRMHCKLCDADEIVPRQRGRDPWESTLAAWFAHARDEHDMDHERAENEMWSGAMEWTRPPQPGSHSHLRCAEVEVRWDWVVRMYEERHWSQAEIADALLMSRWSVQNVLMRRGVELRERGAVGMRPEVRQSVSKRGRDAMDLKACGRKGYQASLAHLTKEQIRANSRKGVEARWRKKSRVDGSQLFLPMG